MIKKYKKYIKEDKDYEEELDYEEEPDLSIILWGPHNRHDYQALFTRNTIYILQDIEKNHVILYDDEKCNVHMNNPMEFITFLTEDDLENYIYNNKVEIAISKKGRWEYKYWKDIPKELKFRLL